MEHQQNLLCLCLPEVRVCMHVCCACVIHIMKTHTSVQPIPTLSEFPNLNLPPPPSLLVALTPAHNFYFCFCPRRRRRRMMMKRRSISIVSVPVESRSMTMNKRQWQWSSSGRICRPVWLGWCESLLVSRL